MNKVRLWLCCRIASRCLCPLARQATNDSCSPVRFTPSWAVFVCASNDFIAKRVSLTRLVP